MPNTSDEEQSGNLNAFWKTDVAFRPLSSDRRDEIFEILDFLIYLRKDNLEGHSKYQLLIKVRKILDNYLRLLNKVREGNPISQPTNPSLKDLIKLTLDVRIHFEVDKLHPDEYDRLVEVAMFLQGKQEIDLGNVGKTLNLWLREAEKILQKL